MLKVIPDSKNIVVESYASRNMLVMHCAFGSKVNNTIASLLSTILSSQIGYIVESRSDAYRIMLTSSARITQGKIEAALRDVYDLEPVLIAALTGTHNINWKVWMVAKRFGMISKEAVYDKKVADRKSTRLNSSHLVISYAVFCLKKKREKVMRSQQL